MRLDNSSQEAAWASELNDLPWSYRKAKAVWTAHSVGIFEHLGKGTASSADLVGRLALKPELTDKLMIVCAAMGLVERLPDGWKLTPRAEATLVPEAIHYIGHWLRTAELSSAFWLNLDQEIRQENDAEAGPQSHQDFVRTMHNLAMGGRAADLADALDLSGRTHLLDVGGGPGTYSIAFCQRYPKLRATILDIPEALEVAEETIARFGLGDRISTRIGDWDDPVYEGDNDVLLFSNVLHGPESGAESKLESARRSLASGGLLIVHDFFLDNSKTGPLKSALFNLHTGAFSQGEFEGIVQDAGFIDVEFHWLTGQMGTSVLTAQKP